MNPAVVESLRAVIRSSIVTNSILQIAQSDTVFDFQLVQRHAHLRTGVDLRKARKLVFGVISALVDARFIDWDDSSGKFQFTELGAFAYGRLDAQSAAFPRANEAIGLLKVVRSFGGVTTAIRQLGKSCGQMSRKALVQHVSKVASRHASAAVLTILENANLIEIRTKSPSPKAQGNRQSATVLLTTVGEDTLLIL